ncbi:MAG: hypothetical protein KF773_11935 [Deltaproteobacteria bacterium]|nr:hypothetical protein [Deltaproteobacteria bacterium]
MRCAACLVSIGALVAAGACSDAVQPGVGPAWRSGPELPDGRRRLEAGVAAMGTQLVVAGGIENTVIEGLDVTREVLALDTLTGAWSQLPDAPVALTHINLAAVGGRLYLLGGLEGPTFIARGASYELAQGATEWTQIESMPAGLERGAAAVVTGPNQIFVLGGAGSTSAVASCLVYDIAARTWRRLPDLPNARSHPAAMRQRDGTLIVAGGLATLDARAPLADVFALRVNDEAWTGGRHPMLTARGGCAYGTALGELVCAGGEAGNEVLSAVESYDPVMDLWTQLPDMPAPRGGTQGAVVGQLLYVPGGAAVPAFEPESTVLVFSPLAAPR